jgi:peptide/nickel transport system substrate-binding protein
VNTRSFDITRRQVLAGGAGLGLMAFLAACGGSSSTSGSPSSSGGESGSGASGADLDLVVAWPGDADSFDAQNSSSSSMDWDLWVNFYEVLLNCKYVDNGKGVEVWDGIEVAPGLAKSWETQDDAIIFHLDETRKFYPSGNPFTADDVIYSFQRMFNLKKNSLLAYAGVATMSQITKIDDHTVQVKCLDLQGNPQTAGPFQLAVFRFPDLCIVDSVEVQKHATSDDPAATAWLTNNTAGSGPYYVKSRQVGQSIELAAVPGHPANPAYKNITIQVTGSVLSLVKGGSVDVAIYGMTEKDVDSLTSDSKLEIQESKAPEFYFLQVPVDPDGPVGNKLVRQALAYTVPYDEIIKSLFAGRTTKMLSAVVPDANGYTPAWGKYTLDINKAKALMKQAGNPDVTVPLHFQNNDTTAESMAILIKSSAAQAGINIVLMPQTSADFSAFNRQRGYPPISGAPDIMLNKYGVWIDDPSITMQGYFYSKGSTGGVGMNFAHYSNAQVDEVIEKWYGKAASDARAADWVTAQNIVADDLPMIPIVHANRIFVTKKGIRGITMSPEMTTRYYTLTPPK